jgi:hypothetical protein
MECMDVCTDVWIYGCIDIRMYACMDAWISIQIYGNIHECMYGCMDVRVYRCVDINTDICIYGYMEYEYKYECVHVCLVASDASDGMEVAIRCWTCDLNHDWSSAKLESQ